MISRDAAARLEELAGGSPERVHELRRLVGRAARDGGDDAIDVGLIERLEPLLLAVADARWWGEKVGAVSPEARAALMVLAEGAGLVQVSALAESLGKQRTTVEMILSGLVRLGLVRRAVPGAVALTDPTLQRYLRRQAEEVAEEAE